MKPFTKFVNYKKQKGFEADADVPASEAVDLKLARMPESITRVWGNLLSRVETRTNAQPTNGDGIKKTTEEVAAGLPEFAQPVSETPEAPETAIKRAPGLSLEGQEDADLAQTEPDCLNDLFWDLKIDNNRNCLHKW